MSNVQSEGVAHRKRVLDILRGCRQAQVLIACAELVVFAALADGARYANGALADGVNDRLQR